jgi:hypothetical protein
MRRLAVIVTALTVAAVQLHAGILDWLLGSRDDNAKTIEWMMTYWDENVSHVSLPKEDALRLAKACLHYDRNPKQRFVDMMEYSHTDAILLQNAFHSYDPDTQRFTDPATTDMTVNGPIQLTHAGRLLLIMMRDDVPNANFLERVMDSPSKHSDNGAVSKNQSNSQRENAGQVSPPAEISPPRFVTNTQSVSVGAVVLPAGTRLEFVSKEAADVRIRYEGAEYAIPISATDLK